MSSIVTSIIDLVTGALLNKCCDYTANKLKEGDLTDEKCRELIVRELDDIKTKLDGLARKDLLSSVSFISDGVCLLNLSLESPKATFPKEQKDPSQAEGSMLMNLNTSLRSESSAVSEALTLSQTTLRIASEERFRSAKTSFEKAYSKATEAFNNEALCTSDRILAAKLRVISKILEYLEDSDAAAAFCKLYLQQLHDLPSVKKIFSVHFRNGIKKRFNKAKRTENVGIVMLINYILYEYVKMFTNMGADTIFSWPKIKLTKRLFHPLLVENEILRKLELCGIHSPNQFIFNEGKEKEKWAKHVSVSSKGGIIVSSNGSKCLEIFDNQGKPQCSLCLENNISEGKNFEILAVTTDREDNVYIVSRWKASETFCYKLAIFDEKGNITQQVGLDCLTGPGESHHSVCIGVNQDKNIFITKQDEARVIVLDSELNLKYSFAIETWHLIKYMTITDKNEIIAAELVGKTVSIYTEDGTFKQDIKVPGLHKVCGLAFHHVTKAILVVTKLMPGNSTDYQLECYSKNGELLQTLPLPEKRDGWYKITSHPHGSVALVYKTGVLFLHH